MRKLMIGLVLLALSGCVTVPRAKILQKLELELTKDEVLERIGRPTVVRGAMVNKYGQKVEVWEYELWKYPDRGEPFFYDGRTIPYWLYFVDGILKQWGEAGDWKEEPDRIYEFRWR